MKPERATRILLATTLAAAVLATLLLSGCTYSIWSSTRQSKANMSGSFVLMTADKTQNVTLQAGDRMVLDYEVSLKKGTLTVAVLDSDGTALFSEVFTGQDSSHKTTNVTAPRDGTYTVSVTARDAGGSYNLSWTIGK